MVPYPQPLPQQLVRAVVPYPQPPSPSLVRAGGGQAVPDPQPLLPPPLTRRAGWSPSSLRRRRRRRQGSLRQASSSAGWADPGPWRSPHPHLDPTLSLVLVGGSSQLAEPARVPTWPDQATVVGNSR